ncbi:MAG: Isoprenyl transferase [Alphaproteobacteria bacterium MarineAlpha5_Bin9]|nr:MAG: Isoprenyl transferase [Alphaproteobacteria bacterium MarineAlpha5_Bin9]|tara:strand:- start:20317 stop:20961 length:645 start_codon:yes stop_codon:yes gene_type:complete
MDGNARWAKKNKLSLEKGYKKGIEKLNKVVDISIENKINYLSVFALSTENFKRKNVHIIFNIITNFLDEFINKINKEKVKINIFGNRSNLPNKIIKIFNDIEKKTKNNKKIILNVGFNYGSKDEIMMCIKKIKKSKEIDSINEKVIRKNLYFPNIPDPDILIRTGGFNRLSNFLLYQLSYTELFFIKSLWPDITKKQIESIFMQYQKIERKHGL